MDSLISVIVPVFNIENYLPRCLRAIQEQTYQNLEIILVDDGSTDKSGEICEEFASKDPRVKVIHQPNTGLWAARNVGHDAAHGDFLFFPDGDDYFHQETLRLLYEAINSKNGYNLAICRMTRTWKDNEDVSSPVPLSLTEKSRDDLFQNLFGKEIQKQYALFMWNKLFRSTLIKGFRTNNFPRSQDKDYMIRLFLTVDKAILIDSPLYYWHIRPESLSRTKTAWAFFHECQTKICYQNYMTLPENGRTYSHYLLENLYSQLLFWRNQSWSLPNHKAIILECKSMIKKTEKAFVFCRDIPLKKRVICLILAHHPLLTRLLIRLSHNS